MIVLFHQNHQKNVPKLYKEISNLILKNYIWKVLYLIYKKNFIKCKKRKTKVYIQKFNFLKLLEKFIEYVICFILDNTGTMQSRINSLKNICDNWYDEIINKFK